MAESIRALLSEQALTLFAIITIGLFVGKLRFRGFSLGASGVLFAGMVFGHYKLIVPTIIRDVGLLLFVYAVGLQVGPRFIRLIRQTGWQYGAIVLAISSVAAGVTIALARSYHLDYALATGLFTGATTCTPALAAGIDLLNKTSASTAAQGAISVGYGIAYPFSMLGTVLLIQIMPKLLGRNAKVDAEKWETESYHLTPQIRSSQFEVANPAVVGKTMHEVNVDRMIDVNISRIRRGSKVFPLTPSTLLELGDILMAVGPTPELDKLSILIGPETSATMDINPDLVSRDIDITSSEVEGKALQTLKVWENLGVVITRVRRQGIEVTPSGCFVLEVGDNVRAVGLTTDVDNFAKWAGAEERRLEETNLLSLALGLALGIALGSIQIHFPTGTIKLGAAGGSFIVALLMGHFGRIGPLRVYVPPAANVFARDIGLTMFLAGAGTTAGQHFVEVVRSSGATLLLISAAITVSAWLTALIIMAVWRKFNVLATMGVTSAGMTNPPALAAASNQANSELITLSYAAAYPVALIAKIIFAQLMLQILSR